MHANSSFRPSDQQVESSLEFFSSPREYPQMRPSFGDSLETAEAGSVLNSPPNRVNLAVPPGPVVHSVRVLAAVVDGDQLRLRRSLEVYRSAFRYCRGVKPINRWNVLLKWLWSANPDRRPTSVSDKVAFPSNACARSTRFLSTN